jgi:hypothetical protein
MSTFKGVETNEYSRFVDHTLATPWETFISDIEKSLRLLNKLTIASNSPKSQVIELNLYERELLNLPNVVSHTNLYDPNYINKKISIKYSEIEFVIEEFSTLNSSFLHSSSTSQQSWITKLLGFPSFLLFYYSSEGIISSVTSPTSSVVHNILSMKTTILSAFTIAVKAVTDLFLPIFFTLDKFDRWNLNLIRDCIGYKPVRVSLSSHSRSSHEILLSPTTPATSGGDIYWIRYESVMTTLLPASSSASITSSLPPTVSKSINSSTSSNNSNKLSSNSLVVISSINRKSHPLFYFDGVRKLYQKKIRLLTLDYNLNILENFMTKIIQYYHFDKKLWISSAMNLINTLNNSTIFVPSVKHLTYSLTNPYDYTSSTPLEITMLANYTTKHFIDILTTLLNCGNYSFHLYEYLKISLTYREAKQSSIIDNEAYSTLLPSRQSPNHWILLPYFKKANYQLLPMNIYNILYFQWKSICIRRLLATFILSSFVKFDGFDFYHFYTNPTSSSHSAGRSAKGGGSSNTTTTGGNDFLFPDPFLLHHESFQELQHLLNSLSKETKYIFSTIFPDEMISFDYMRQHVRSQRSSRSNTTSGDGGLGTGDDFSSSSPPPPPPYQKASFNGETPHTSNSSSDLPSLASSSSSNSSNNLPSYAMKQEQQYQILFQQVFQYLFSPKNDPSSSSAASAASSSALPFPTSFAALERQMYGTAPEGEGEDAGETMEENSGGNKLNYIENWIQSFGILGGLLPCKGPYLLRLWQYCLREYQHYFDSNLMLPWAQKSFSVNMNETFSSGSSSVSQPFSSNESDGLYGKSLWSDVIFKKNNELNVNILLPDTNKSILIQKVMMIFFCILMKKERVVYEIKAINNSTIVILSDEEDEEGEEGGNSGKDEEDDRMITSPYNPPIRPPVPPPPSRPMSVTTQSLLSLNNITLFRRIPLTSDIIAMQQHMLKKFTFERTKIDKIIKDHPLIRYQITIPTLLSDICLFKYYNPNISFAVFYKWYGLQHHPLLGIEDIDEWADTLKQMSEEEIEREKEAKTNESQSGKESRSSSSKKSLDDHNNGSGERNDEEEQVEGEEGANRPRLASFTGPNGQLLSLENIESEKELVTLKLLQCLSEIYYSSDRRSIYDAKPVFSAEKEIGKSIAYLERMNMNNFLLEIIYYSLHFICSFIDQSNNYFNSKKIFLIFINEKLILLKNLLGKFNMIIEVKRKISINIASFSSSSSSSSSSSASGLRTGSMDSNSPNTMRGNRKVSSSFSSTVEGGGSGKFSQPPTSSHPQTTQPSPQPSTNSLPSLLSSSCSSEDVTNEEIIILLDSICIIIEELELFYCKLQQLLPMIEMFMISPFNIQRKNNNNTSNSNGERGVKEGNDEVNDNILQLILHWIERNEEYSCQYVNEVNYIKSMMKQCHNLQQQQQQQSSQSSQSQQQQQQQQQSSTPSVSSMMNENTSSSAIPSPAMGKHSSKHQQLRKDSDSYDGKSSVKSSIDSVSSGSGISSRPLSTTLDPDHDWYSYDGRELPTLPNTKDFHLLSYSKFPLCEVSSSVATQPIVEPVKLDFEEDLTTISEVEDDDRNGLLAIQKDRLRREKRLIKSNIVDKKDIHEFSMILSTDGNSMRMIHEILEIN